jgi:hypothetical protein
MQEVVLDEGDQAFKNFREKMKNFIDYLKYLETVNPDKLTAREKKLLEKHGRRKKK